MSFPRNFVRSGFRKRLTSTSVFCSSYNSLIWRICLRGVESEAHLIANRLHSIQTYNELYKVRLAHAQRNIFVRTYDRHNLDITARILLFTNGMSERDSLRRLMVPHNQLGRQGQYLVWRLIQTVAPARTEMHISELLSCFFD